MDDRFLDILAKWPGNVTFGGNDIELRDKRTAELEQRRKELAAQDGRTDEEGSGQ